MVEPVRFAQSGRPPSMTAGIQEAIDDSGGNGEIILGKGIHLVDRPLRPFLAANNGLIIRGVSPESTIINCGGNDFDFLSVGANGTQITLENLSIRNSGKVGRAIRWGDFSGISGWFLKSLDIQGWAMGIDAQVSGPEFGGNDNTLIDVDIHDCAEGMWQIGNSWGNVCFHCQFRNCDNIAFRSSAVQFNSFHGCTFNSFTSTGRALVLDGAANHSFHGCDSEVANLNSLIGVLLRTDPSNPTKHCVGVSFHGHTFGGASPSLAPYGLQIGDNPSLAGAIDIGIFGGRDTGFATAFALIQASASTGLIAGLRKDSPLLFDSSSLGRGWRVLDRDGLSLYPVDLINPVLRGRFQSGDAQDRVQLFADGTLVRGPGGSTAPDVKDLWGNGSPEGVVAAAPGSTFRRRDGGAGTSVYVKESGTGTTGWVGLGAGGGGGGDSITINSAALVDADFDDVLPAAPAGAVNVKWQKDTNSPANVSAYVERNALVNFLSSAKWGTD